MTCSCKSQFWRWQWSGTIRCWRVSQAAETLPLGWLMSGIIGVSISISISSSISSSINQPSLSRHLCLHYQRRERRRRNTTTTSSTLGILRLNINHYHFFGWQKCHFHFHSQVRYKYKSLSLFGGRNVTFTSVNQKYHFHFLNILFLK